MDRVYPLIILKKSFWLQANMASRLYNRLQLYWSSPAWWEWLTGFLAGPQGLAHDIESISYSNIVYNLGNNRYDPKWTRSPRARAKWFIALTLARNPQLASERKRLKTLPSVSLVQALYIENGDVKIDVGHYDPSRVRWVIFSCRPVFEYHFVFFQVHSQRMV